MIVFYRLLCWLLELSQASLCNTSFNEIFSIKAILFLIFFPLVPFLINGVWIFLLKISGIEANHKSSEAAICSWLKIPYRGKKNRRKNHAENH